jgi:Concanavalin A-like lectin/glucanases superfamily/Domain of unknown function (DUF2341)
VAYGYYRAITIDHTKCGSSDSSSFPVLVAGTYSWLATVAHSGKVQSASGYDIAFFSDSALTTPLKFERESWEGVGGACAFWVKVPTLSHSADTVIYIAYGDATISTDQSDKTNVWDANFKGVYHLGITSTNGAAADSTSANKSMTANLTGAAPVAGQVGGATDVSAGTAGYTTATTEPNLTPGPLTYSCWIYVVTTNSGGGVMANTPGAFGNSGTRLAIDASGADNFIGYVLGGVVGYDFTASAAMKFQTGAWVFIAITVSSAGTTAIAYVGKAGTLTSQSQTISASVSGTPTCFCAFEMNGVHFKGYVDEMKFSSIDRPADWLTAEYNNQYSPSTFYSVGSEQASAGPAQTITLTASIATAESWSTPGIVKTVAVSTIPTAESWPSPKVTGPLTISAIASGESWASPHVVTGPLLAPATIPTAESWPSPAVAGPLTIATIPTGEVWSAFQVRNPVILRPATIPTGVAWFTPALAGPVNIPAIPSGEAWLTPFLDIEQILAPALIPTGENWFAPAIRENTQALLPAAIASGESWPSPALHGGKQWIRLATIPSSERWFRPSVTGGETALYLFISGVDRTPYLRAGDNVCSIDSQTMGRWTLTFDLYDDTGSFKPVEGQTVLLVDIGRRLFSGCIQQVIAARFMSTAQAVVYHCTATDKSSILDHRVVTKDYLMADWEDYSRVILDVATNFLNGEGIDSSGVPPSLGPLSQDYPQNLAKVSDFFNQIARDTGTVWWVEDAVLTFSPLIDLPAAPFSLTETSRNWSNLTVTRTTQDFYNKVYVRSNLQVIPSGTGPTGGASAALEETITFAAGKLNVQMQAGQPTGVLTSLGIGSVVSMTVNGHAQTVVDFDQAYTGQVRANSNDYLWFFGEGNNLLSFTYGPPSDAVIVVTYVPGSPALNTTIAQYGTALNPLDPEGAPLGTCGSGLYEGVVQVNDIFDQDQLDAIAKAVLARVGGIPSVVDYETDWPGLKPGQIQAVNVPNSNISSGQILITRVKGVFMPPDNSRVDYTGAPVGSSFHWTVEGTTNLDPGSNSANYYAKLIERTGHPLPLPRYEDATFAIAPGGSVSTALAIANPYIVKQTGLSFEMVWSWGTPPTDEDLVVTVTRNNTIILTAVLDHTVSANLNTTVPIPASNQLFLYVGDILNVNTSYSVVGPNPTPASSVTFVVRWSY